MHLRRVVSRLAEDIDDFTSGIFTLRIPAGDTDEDLVPTRSSEDLILRNEDVLAKLLVQRDKESVATCQLKRPDIGRRATLENISDLKAFVFTSAIFDEGDGDTIAM